MGLKEKIIDQLSMLISNNVIGDIQYRNRLNGFIGELDFKEFMALHRPQLLYLDGGIFLPTIKDSSYLDSPVYFTVTSLPTAAYLEVYKCISTINCKGMFLLQWDQDEIENWPSIDLLNNGQKLLVPRFLISRYENDEFIEVPLSDFLSLFKIQNYVYTDRVPVKLKAHFVDLLKRFDVKPLLDLYLQRVVFDGLIGFKCERGIPSDIDQIIFSDKTEQYFFLEVKEKDLSKREPVGFGMDVPRIIFFETLQKKTGIETFYFVKQIKDQISRQFVNWRFISISDFRTHCNTTVVEGGTGMRSVNSNNPTLICPEKHFGVFK
ncbi:hypothetical protein [Sphingobacterium faecale]|uniref:DUF3883 domain-containing protein n=1 Tax=Sphingobacterium faecale TaxID=2803775 RepID=A0ABS1QYV4_9SPHI|nr:hypothetical protein [Sphingobacterium faecale]MBL1407611.1 hypothetical protein [Sphingobacterium faecale]